MQSYSMKYFKFPLTDQTKILTDRIKVRLMNDVLLTDRAELE